MGFVHPAQRIAAVGSIRAGAALLLLLLGAVAGTPMESGPGLRVSPDSTAIVGKPEKAKVGGLGGASAMLMVGAVGEV